MLNFDPSYTPWLIAFVVLGVVAGLLGAVALVDSALVSRRRRLAGEKTMRDYYRYRGLTLTR